MLNVSSHARGNAFYVALAGRLDGSPCCESVGTVLQSALSAGHRRFVFDLSQLKSISSCGIGCLIRSHVRLQRADARISLLAPNQRVLRALKITLLVPKVFEVIEVDSSAAPLFSYSAMEATR
jgi:anti-anti-sigma factor